MSRRTGDWSYAVEGDESIVAWLPDDIDQAPVTIMRVPDERTGRIIASVLRASEAEYVEPGA